MADLCRSCAIDTYGEDIGDLAGLSTPDDAAARRYPVVLREGCGPIQVDHTGRRIEGGDQPQLLPNLVHFNPSSHYD